MSKKINDIIPIGCALKESFKKGYSFNAFKSDAVAGLIVSLVALPLAMALSIAVGLPPQHGLYTAIVAGIAVPLLGGSLSQVSGPTAAFVVIVAPIVTEHGLRGLILTTLMAGLILIVLGLAKLGRYINYVPYPVTTGFTSGIAVVIGTLALNDFLGLGIEKLQGDYIHKIALIAGHIPTLHWPEALVGLVSLVLMFTSERFLPKVPSPVIGIGLGTLLAYVLQHHGYDIATIGSRFSYALPGGGAGQGIPPFTPSFHMPELPDLAVLRTLIIPALVIAALGTLESLLSATVADSMAGTKHNPQCRIDRHWHRQYSLRPGGWNSRHRCDCPHGDEHPQRRQNAACFLHARGADTALRADAGTLYVLHTDGIAGSAAHHRRFPHVALAAVYPYGTNRT